MRGKRLTGAALALGAALSGCASFEQKQMAYQGGGPFWSNPCLLGGATAETDAHCRFVQSGPKGMLESINEEVVRDPNNDTCEKHVTAVLARLEDFPQFKAQRIYSCLDYRSSAECHVSALVTDGGGRQYVLDNGAVLRMANTPYVATLRQFAARVDGNYWIGKPPTQVEAMLGRGWDLPESTKAKKKPQTLATAKPKAKPVRPKPSVAAPVRRAKPSSCEETRKARGSGSAGTRGEAPCKRSDREGSASDGHPSQIRPR